MFSKPLIVNTDHVTDEYEGQGSPLLDFSDKSAYEDSYAALGLYFVERDNLSDDHFEHELMEYGRRWGIYQLAMTGPGWDDPNKASAEYDAMNDQRKKFMGMIRELRDKNRG